MAPARFHRAAVGQRRRIFNGKPHRRRVNWRALLLAGGLGATSLCVGLAGASVARLAHSQFAGVFPAATATPVARSMTLAGENAAVVDGETLRVAGHVVRLAGIAAPQRGEACAQGVDCAGAAALRLASLVRDQRVACVLTGNDDVGHHTATCRAGGTDLGRAVIASGWAVAKADDLRQAEREARLAHRGLWAEGGAGLRD